MTWAMIPMPLTKLISLGKWGIGTQGSFTNRLPFCSLILFCRALTGGIQNGIPVLPWQVNTTNLSPGKVIMPTPPATIRMDLPWGKQQRVEDTSIPAPPFPLFFSKGTTAAGLHTVPAGGYSCQRSPWFLISRDWEGVWFSVFTTLNWQLSSGRNRKLHCSAHDAASELRFWQLENQEEKNLETLIDFRSFRG